MSAMRRQRSVVETVIDANQIVFRVMSKVMLRNPSESISRFANIRRSTSN